MEKNTHATSAASSSVEKLLQLSMDSPVKEVRALCSECHPSDIAAGLVDADPYIVWSILSKLDIHVRADIFGHFEEDTQIQLADSLSNRSMAGILEHMAPDERVDFIKVLPETKRDALLPILAQAERNDILRLAAYNEGTSGSVMTSDYVTLSPDFTAAESIHKLRQQAPDKETIYYCYVVSSQRKLIGFISLKDLILAHPNCKVSDLMQTDVIYVTAEEDQETAANLISKYDFLALPVVNNSHELLGIITHDDALDIVRNEQTEDMERFMAIAGEHKTSYLRTSAWTHIKNRCPWVTGLAIVGFVSGAILHHFEATLETLFILALYLPMITDTGGNTGSQAATVIIRSIALQEIQLQDTLSILLKELIISCAIAALLFGLAFGKVLWLSQNVHLPEVFTLTNVALVIAMALSVQVVTATLIGAFLPLAAVKMKVDPAVVASPAITTLVDITGLLIYFTCVGLFLSI